MYLDTSHKSQNKFQDDEEIKRAALGFIGNAWADGVASGVDSNALAHAAMFTAFVDLVTTFGEDAVAELTETLPERVRRGDYSAFRHVQ